MVNKFQIAYVEFMFTSSGLIVVCKTQISLGLTGTGQVYSQRGSLSYWIYFKAMLFRLPDNLYIH
jgi:hypothetical protein